MVHPNEETLGFPALMITTIKFLNSIMPHQLMLLIPTLILLISPVSFTNYLLRITEHSATINP